MRIPPINLSTASWRKSSYSNSEGGECVEIADSHSPLTPVRDSKRPEGPALLVAAPAWTAFVGHLKHTAG
ncbi:DUF397 domain-containing protein [Streptomyces aurantiacus]|uniref:DUF397 domain-containing protein n=1 Tax=Streptomyces aurantiacus TaxID=47760 RepID=UPI000B123552|nr:DUF397 domain-containing protein [Streptomyces aurantiacus]